MSGERVDGIKSHVLKIELDLFSGGFEPYVADQQDGFWVQLEEDDSASIHWYPADWADRVGHGADRYRYEERTIANKMHRAYAAHLREVAEEEARIAYQKLPEEYTD